MILSVFKEFYNMQKKLFSSPLKKVQSSQNNPEKCYTEKKARHEPSGWSMSIICSFDKKKSI